MSNVRLSNGSPTLERTDSGRVSGGDHHPKPSACRSLFGAVDHEELRRDLKGHLRGMEEAASARWNFDFANHAPLATGRFDWEIVDCRDVPDFYSRTQQQQHRGGGAAAAGATVAVGVCSNKRQQQQRTAAVAGNNNVDVNGNHSKCVVLVGQGTNGGSTTVGQGTTGAADRADTGLMECGEQCTGGGQRKRPACHESTAQNKRSHTSSDEVRCPNMTLSSELTPRKSSPRRQT